MIFGVYSIRDSLSGFMTPVIETSDAVALRNFSMACESYPHSGASVMRWKPEDFSLFHIGDFDTDSGVLTPFDPPKLIVTGLSLSLRERDPARASDKDGDFLEV